MANRLLRFIRRHLIGDVPTEMTVCFDCTRPDCSAEVYRSCTRRLLGREELASPPLAPLAKVASRSR